MTIYNNPTIKVKLRNSTTLSVPLPPFVNINAISINVVNSISIGNTTVNTQINSTAISVRSLRANGSFGTFGQVLTSNGTGVYWSTVTGGGGGSFSNGIAYTWSDVQTFAANVVVDNAILSVGNTTSNVTANTTHIVVGNSTVNVSINSTAFSGTANNSNNLSGLSLATIQGQITSNADVAYANAVANAAALYQTTAGLSANVITLTANDSNRLGTQLPAYYTNATNITTGTLSADRLPANAVFWSNTNTFTAVQTLNQNLIVNSASLSVGNTTANVTTNTTHIVVGNSTVNVSVNSTVFSGTANNATNLGGVAAASYINTTGAYTITGVHTMNANLIVNSAVLHVGNTTANVFANTTHIVVGNSTVNVSVNSTAFSGIANNANNLGGQLPSFYRDATNINAGTLDFARLPANAVFWSNTNTFTAVQTLNQNLIVNSATLSVGNTTSNVTANTTHIVVGNSTVNVSVNSTVFSGTSNNTLNLGGVAAASYVNTSGAYTITGVHTLNANLIVNSAVLHVGNTTANVTTNTTHIVVGNSTVNVSINSTAFSGTANNANNLGGQLPSFYTNATNLATGTVPTARLATSGTPSSTTFLRGDQVWATPPGGGGGSPGGLTTQIQFNDAGAFQGSANLTFDNSTTFLTIGNNTTNTQINSSSIAIRTLIANGGVGSSGQVLTSSGTGANLYWQTLSAFSTSTPYSFTAVQTFNQNVIVNAATFSVGNTTANVTANTTQIVVGNSTVNVSINSTAFSGISNNANNLGGQLPSFYTNATNITTGTLDFARLPANAVFWSNTNTFTAVQTFNQNLVVNSATLSVGNTTANITANTTELRVGNSTVNVSVNSTVFSGTSNNTLNLGGVAAASYVNTSGAYTITGVHTMNANLIVNSATFSVGNTTANITANTTVLTVGNTTVNVSINSTAFSGTANNANNLGGVLAANYVNTSGAYTITGVHTLNANLFINTANHLLIGNNVVNTSANQTTIIIQNSADFVSANATTITFNGSGTINATSYTGTAANATNLNGQLGSFYTNATNLTTGTVPTARLATSGTPSSTTFLRGDQVWATPPGGGGGSPGGLTTQIQFNDAGAFAGSANLTFDTATTLMTVGTSTTNTQINSTSISTNNLNIASKINVGTGVGFNFGTLAQIEVDSNQNTYSQIVMQNANTGTNASGDLVITADNGTDSVNFVDLGIGSSNYSNTQFALHGPLDAYLYSSNSHLVIGTAIGREIIFHANGFALSDRKLTVNATALTISNSISLVANGAAGTLGQMLTSNGTGVYWSTPPGGGGGGEIVTSISTNTNAAAPTTFYIATGTINITLPTAIGNSGLRFNIKNAGFGIITVLPQSGQFINGDINMIMGERNSVMGVISDGTGWNIY